MVASPPEISYLMQDYISLVIDKKSGPSVCLVWLVCSICLCLSHFGDMFLFTFTFLMKREVSCRQ
jgi:hypothetical protein